MRILFILSAVLLTGCFGDTNDLKLYIANVQSTTASSIEPT